MDANNIREALLEILTPKTTKKDKKTPKYVLVVDDKVLQNRPASKKQLEQAVIAIKIKNPQSKIICYKFHSELDIKLPITGIETENTESEGER